MVAEELLRQGVATTIRGIYSKQFLEAVAMLDWLFGGSDKSVENTVKEITQKTNRDRVKEGAKQYLKAISNGQDPSDILEEIEQILGSINEE